MSDHQTGARQILNLATLRIRTITQVKIVTLVAFIAIAIMAALIWRTNSLLAQEKTAFVNDSAIKQIAPLKRLVQQRLADEKSALIAFASLRAPPKSSSTTNSGEPNGAAASENFGNFDVVALVQQTPAGPWTPTWVDKRPDAREDRWPQGYDQTLLKSLNYSRAKDGETTWVRVSDRQGVPIYAFMITVELRPAQAARETLTNASKTLPDTAEQALSNMQLAQKAVLVGFTSQNPLAEVTEDFIGSTNSVYIVDDRGFVASHVNRAYQGALFTEDPLVRDILKGKRAGATGRFEDLESRPVLGHYERIEHSNLFAIIATPEQVINSMIGSQRVSMLQTALAALLFAIALGSLGAWLITRSPSLEDSQGEGEVDIGGGEVPAPEIDRNEVSGDASLALPLADKPERQDTRILGDGMSKAILEPLHGILGHASLVRAKATDDDLAKHADSITREARRLKEIVERIHEWEAEIQPSPNAARPVDLAELVAAEIDARETDFTNDSIHVTRELKAVPEIWGDRAALKKAVGNIIDNAVEALVSRPAKRLRFETVYQNNEVVFLVTDTGIGMARETRDRAFEPFYKGFEAEAHLGLGLSTVAAIVKDSGGEYSVESTPGEGSTFTFSFPVSDDLASVFNAKELGQITEPAAPKVDTEVETEIEITSPVSEELIAPRIHEENIEIESLEASHQGDSVDLSDSSPELPVTLQGDLFDEVDIDFGEPLSAPIHTAPFAAASPVPLINTDALKESRPIDEKLEASAGPLMLDELDDDDEIFANVPLNKATNRLTKVGQLPTPSTPSTSPAASAGQAKNGFEVKIRKPQKRRSPKDSGREPEKGME